MCQAKVHLITQGVQKPKNLRKLHITLRGVRKLLLLDNS